MTNEIDIQTTLRNANRLLSAHHSQYRFELNDIGGINVTLCGEVIDQIPVDKVNDELTNIVAVECQDHM